MSYLPHTSRINTTSLQEVNSCEQAPRCANVCTCRSIVLWYISHMKLNLCIVLLYRGIYSANYSNAHSHAAHNIPYIILYSGKILWDLIFVDGWSLPFRGFYFRWCVLTPIMYCTIKLISRLGDQWKLWKLDLSKISCYTVLLAGDFRKETLSVMILGYVDRSVRFISTSMLFPSNCCSDIYQWWFQYK